MAEKTSVAITDEELDGSIDDEIMWAVDVDGNDNLQCMHPNDSDESVKPKMISSPSPPSRQEVLEHNITHLPFRCRCRHCVMGNAKADGHITTGSMAASEVLVVSFDYAFLGDRKSPMTSGQDEAKKDEYEEDDADVKQVTKVLVGCDAKSRVCTAIPMPQKGIDQDEWAAREALRFLELLGHTSVVLKNDQESNRGVVLRRLRTHRGDITPKMTGHSPVGESKSNGCIERTIQSVEGQIRTSRIATQRQLGRKLVPGSALFARMVVSASNLVSLYEMGNIVKYSTKD